MYKFTKYPLVNLPFAIETGHYWVIVLVTRVIFHRFRYVQQRESMARIEQLDVFVGDDPQRSVCFPSWESPGPWSVYVRDG